MNAISQPQPRLAIAPRPRRALLTVHIVASVGLLGEIAGYFAVALRAATTDDPALAASAHELLDMFSLVFGIPLSMITLASGIALGVGSKWGVLRYPWVTAKLALIASVILVGALILGPTNARAMAGADVDTTLVLASAYDVLALIAATALSVFKPGRRRRSASSA